MPQERLNPTQRNLIKELEEICGHYNLDWYNIGAYPPDQRTPYLQVARDKIVRGQVITYFTVVDDLLATEICRYYFGRRQSLFKLWRTRKFKIFNHYVIEELHTLQKLRHVRAIRKVPSSIVSDIERLNALRNTLAHTLFPENTRKGLAKWKGVSIFSVAGLKALQQDFEKVVEYFMGV